MAWQQQYSFRLKTMAYQQSCFPCCLQMILRNLGKYGETNEIENHWNQLQLQNQKPNLNTAAPNEDDVHRNVAQTDFKGAGCRIITPSMLGPTLNHVQFQQEIQRFFTDYQGLVIGVGHATVVYYTGNDYVYVRPAPDLNNTQVEHDAQIQLQLVQGNNNSYALQIDGVNNNNLSIVGNFLMLLR